MLTSKKIPSAVSPPRSAQPFNKGLRAQGRDTLAPGALRGSHRRHFARQEWIGIGLMLLVFFGTAYGISRNVTGSLLAIGLGVLFIQFPRQRLKTWLRQKSLASVSVSARGAKPASRPKGARLDRDPSAEQ
ncbi:MAG: hypothetical protein AB8H80_13765 [Planctomycetota bacterium]